MVHFHVCLRKRGLDRKKVIQIQCTTFKAGDDRISTLTEKQKEQFEAYMSAQREVNVLTEGKMREI